MTEQPAVYGVTRAQYEDLRQENEESQADSMRTREAAYQLWGMVEELVKLGKDVVVQYALPSRTDPASKAFMAGLKRAEEVLAETERVQLQAKVEQLMKRLINQEERTHQLAEIAQALVDRIAELNVKYARPVGLSNLSEAVEYVNLTLAIKEMR